jgi:hypothetical protein
MKKQFLLPAAAVLGGVAALILRLLQNRTGYEADTGLPIPGAPAGIALAVWLVILAVVFCLLTAWLPKEGDPGPALPADFYTENSKLLFLPVMGLMLMAVAGLADIYEGLGMGNLLSQMASAADPAAISTVSTSDGIFSGRLQLLMGVMSLASAASLLPAAAACRRPADQRQEGQLLTSGILLVPPVCLVVRLVLTYRADSVDPSLGAYYVELLALVFLTLGFYRLASFTVQAGRTRRFALYASAAVTLSITALADGGPHLSSLLLYVGGALTLLGFLLMRLAAPVYQTPVEPEYNDNN